MISDKNIKNCVHKHHLFSSLVPQELAILLETAARMHFEPQENIIYQGDKALRFYLIIEGHLQLYRTSLQGQEKVIEVVRQGRTFAEALMFSEQCTYPVSAQAVSPCQLISFDSESYLKMLRNNPKACIAIMADMSVRLRKDLNEVEILSVQNAQNRFLLFLQRNINYSQSNHGVIKLDIPKRMLASRLSIQPETFSRLINKMVKDGLIIVDGGLIEVPDLNRLYANSDIPLAHLPLNKQINFQNKNSSAATLQSISVQNI